MEKTLKQLAQEAGVSIATVSKVVNGRDEHISEATRKRIRELVESSGYRPNAIAKGLKEKRPIPSVLYFLTSVTRFSRRLQEESRMKQRNTDLQLSSVIQIMT